MSIRKTVIGDISWTRPDWLQELGRKGLVTLISLICLAGFITLAAVRYYDSLPKPPRIVAQVNVPGITPVVDGVLKPQPLTIDFAIQVDAASEINSADRANQFANESLARIDLLDKPLTTGVSIAPAIPGEWRWQDENTLIFQPQQDWPAGQQYRVSFDPSLFAPGSARKFTVASKQVRFATEPFTAALDELVFYQDPQQSSDRKVVASLSFSHPVDEASLRRKLSFAMRASGATLDSPAKPVTYELDFDENQRRAYVHSEQINLPEHASYLNFHLAAHLQPAQGRGTFANELTESVLIPDAISYFRASSVQSTITRNTEDEPEQTLTFEFTDRVRTEALQKKLSAYLLPTTLTLDGGQIRNKRWHAAREVTPEVLSQASAFTVKLNPVPGDSSQLHSATIDVPEHSYLYVRIEEGLGSDSEFLLSIASESLLRGPAYPKEVSVAQDGAVLPLTSSKKLSFVSRGVNTLRVEIGRLLDNQVNHLASQTYGDLRSPYFSSYNFNEDNLTERFTRFIDLAARHPKTAAYASIDLGEYLAGGGYYFITVQGWDRKRDRAVSAQDKRLVLITDLGLLVKTSSDNAQDVFVHSIATGKPVSGAQVQLLGKNGLPVIKRTTNTDGHTTMPPTDSLEREQAPTVFVVRNGADSVFMPYGRGDRMLQYSRFDVGGEYVRRRNQNEQLRAQLFSDRGLYRPGDTAQLAAIVKREDWTSLGSLPLAISVTDPRGQIVMDKRIILPEDGFLDESFTTDTSFATGNYNATLYLIDDKQRRRAIGNTRLKIEEFQPDRLRIHAKITGAKPQGWVKPGELAVDVTLHNLFGTAAAARRVTGVLDLQPIGIRMPRYPGFVFDDPLRLRSGSNQSIQKISLPLAPTTTNENGLASLPLDLAQYDQGIYQLIVSTEGFEGGGGRSVKARTTIMMSPLDTIIGYKADGDLSFVGRDSARSVEFIAVDSDANAQALAQLTLSISEESHVSTLVKQANGTFAYQSVVKETQRSSQPWAISASGNTFNLPTDRPGTFVVKISDSNGLTYTNVRYTVAGARNLAGNLEKNAELELKLNGTSFDPGEEIEMEITAPYTGTGLITIERDRVYSYKWFTSDTHTSVQKITVPADLEGNAYINVAFVRDMASPEIFVSPLSYAVQTFQISRDARSIDISLKAPDKVRPGEALTVQYKTSKPGRIVIYAVDEGILQVAGYNMPDPLDFFLRKMALQVNTFQMADLILPDFETYQRHAAPGGGARAKLAGRNLNPFQRRSENPIAFWSGIVAAGPQAKTVSFDVPDYFSGELRIMALAVSAQAAGSAQSSTIARGPFVITPSALSAAAPGDEFDVYLGLSNNLEGSDEKLPVDLALEASEHLQIVGKADQQLTIDEGAEGRTSFRVRALDKPGPATLTFTARAAEESISRSVSLSIRPSVPYIATVVAGSNNADPLTLSLDRQLYKPLAKQSVSASVSPLVLSDGLLNYLAAFPHGCAEQIVSKVFPQLGFLGNQDKEVDKAGIRKLFNDAIKKLRSRQGTGGGFRFWTTSKEPADFATVYIMHFLTDAKALGLSVPRDMQNAGLDYLKQVAARQTEGDTPDTGLAEARLRAYAIYILTRNGIVTTNHLTNLHEHLEEQQSSTWRNDLSAAYMAASYILLKKAPLGERLIDAYVPGAGALITSDFDTRLGRDAQYVYLLARHFPRQMRNLPPSTMQHLAEPVMQNRFNTLSSAYTVMALAQYTQARSKLADGKGLVPLTISYSGEHKSGDQPGRKVLSPPAVFARTMIEHDQTNPPVEDATPLIQISGSNGEEIYYVLSQTGFDRQPPSESLSEGIEIYREYLNNANEVVDSAQIGEELTVRLRVRSTDILRSNVAVVDLLPGGFQVLSDSLRNQHRNWYADYTDIREDRVVIYGSFRDEVKEITYRVKVTSSGNFAVPAAYATSMYDHSIQSHSKPGRFSVSALSNTEQ